MLVLPEVLAVDGLHVRGCHARHRPAAQETLCCSQTKKSNSHWGTGVVVLYAGAGVGAAMGRALAVSHAVSPHEGAECEDGPDLGGGVACEARAVAFRELAVGGRVELDLAAVLGVVLPDKEAKERLNPQFTQDLILQVR